LPVLGASPASLGINQRAHAALDQAVLSRGIGYTTLRPAVFTTAFTDVAGQIRATASWSGAAPAGRNPFTGPRGVGTCAAAVLLDHSWRGQHINLTGPELYSWPDIAALLTEELGRPISYQVCDDASLLAAMIGRGLPEAVADLLVARARRAKTKS